MRVCAAAFQNQPPMWLSTASAYRRSLPMRCLSTVRGTLPLRKPGILTVSARSDAAWSTAWFTSAPGTSTVRRTLLSPSSSTCACMRGHQSRPRLGYELVVLLWLWLWLWVGKTPPLVGVLGDFLALLLAGLVELRPVALPRLAFAL